MTEYRDRTTGEIKTQGELRRDNPNMSMPKVWNSNVHDALNVDPVLPASPPTNVGTYQIVERDGAVQNSNGDWIQAYRIVDRFSDGDAGTKAEQEAAYQAELDELAAQGNRSIRDGLIAETDWWALPDSPTMTDAQTTYRQALRDITTHSNWPHLEDSDWPTKP
jgi:hypothetical protein